MLKKLCPNCHKVIDINQRRCEACKPIAVESKALRAKRYNETRNPAHVAFYQCKAWKQLRAAKLAQVGYICEQCKAEGVTTLAEDVHHIVPISEDWSRRFDIYNLQALCINHHNKIHGRF